MKALGKFSAADWRRPSVVALLLANLIPVFGVIALGWEVFPLMFLFWSENVVIGVINALRMLCSKPESGANWAAKLFLVPFFCVHYGIFTFVHGVFVMMLFRGGQTDGFPGIATFWKVMREYHLGWAVLALAVSHGVSFFSNFIRNGEYQRNDVSRLMAAPYARIFVLHLTILGGGLLMLWLRSPLAGLLVLIGLKTCVDLVSHLVERRKFLSAPQRNANALPPGRNP